MHIEKKLSNIDFLKNLYYIDIKKIIKVNILVAVYILVTLIISNNLFKILLLKRPELQNSTFFLSLLFSSSLTFLFISNRIFKKIDRKYLDYLYLISPILILIFSYIVGSINVDHLSHYDIKNLSNYDEETLTNIRILNHTIVWYAQLLFISFPVFVISLFRVIKLGRNKE